MQEIENRELNPIKWFLSYTIARELDWSLGIEVPICNCLGESFGVISSARVCFLLDKDRKFNECSSKKWHLLLRGLTKVILLKRQRFDAIARDSKKS